MYRHTLQTVYSAASRAVIGRPFQPPVPQKYAVPVAEADVDNDGAAVVTPGQGTDPQQPVPASGERGTVEVGARVEECTAPATGGWCISSSGGGGGSGGGESGTAIDAATSVSAAGAAGAGGLEMASSSNLELLATVCLRAENESCRGIESGGGGDGVSHEVSIDFRIMAEHLGKRRAIVALPVLGTMTGTAGRPMQTTVVLERRLIPVHPSLFPAPPFWPLISIGNRSNRRLCAGPFARARGHTGDWHSARRATSGACICTRHGVRATLSGEW